MVEKDTPGSSTYRSAYPPAEREVQGARLSPTVMAHMFRGELSRSDTWRTRLDTTTNWALTTAAAVISVAFASPTTPHVTLLVGLWMVVSFLMIEARRYRYYDLWNRRVRLLEDGYWAPLLRGEPVDPDAIRELAQEMDRPQIRLSLVSALGTRMNRTYSPIMAVLILAWFVKVYSHPQHATSWRIFLENAHIGPVEGWLVAGGMVLATLAFLVLMASAMLARPPLGELRVRPRSHRLAMWDVFLRPYGTPQPRHRPRPPLRAPS